MHIHVVYVCHVYVCVHTCGTCIQYLVSNSFPTSLLHIFSSKHRPLFDSHLMCMYLFICTCTTPHQCGLRNKQYCSCFSRHSTILTSSHLRQDQIDPVVAVDTIVHMDLCLQWAVALIVGGLDSPAMDPIVLTSLLEI